MSAAWRTKPWPAAPARWPPPWWAPAWGSLISPVAVHTRGGEILNVYFKPQAGACSEVYLEGDALVVYQGELWVEELK